MAKMRNSNNAVHFLVKGGITSCDLLFAHLHGYPTLEEVVGLHIKDLIPAVQIPLLGKKIPKVYCMCQPLSSLSLPLGLQVHSGFHPYVTDEILFGEKQKFCEKGCDAYLWSCQQGIFELGMSPVPDVSLWSLSR